jgi:hypothetical protein
MCFSQVLCWPKADLAERDSDVRFQGVERKSA